MYRWKKEDYIRLLSVTSTIPATAITVRTIPNPGDFFVVVPTGAGIVVVDVWGIVVAVVIGVVVLMAVVGEVVGMVVVIVVGIVVVICVT